MRCERLKVTKLKATVAQLSEITGIHRNTITNRVWPIQKLKQIKEARKVEEISKKNQELLNKESMEDKLTRTQNEVVYWFNEYQDMKRFFEHSNNRFQEMRKARDYYKTLYETERKVLFEAEQEIERLKLKNISSEKLKN